VGTSTVGGEEEVERKWEEVEVEEVGVESFGAIRREGPSMKWVSVKMSGDGSEGKSNQRGRRIGVPRVEERWKRV